ncbi:MAG: mechanosensitive ion channel family protein [Leptospirillia bacterium]
MDITTFFSETDWLNTYLIPWGINLTLAVLTFVLGRWAAGLVTRALGHMLEKAGVDMTLTRFLRNIVRTALLAVVVIMALGQLGVDTTSVLAVFAAAGLAVGLALKDSLSNFAAGVLLILYRPFSVGNYIEAGGAAGTVQAIRIFNTVLTTPDNREVTVPNAQIFGGTILNASARDTRRIDLVFGIGYGDNVAEAKQVLADLMAKDDRILAEPEPFIGVVELADNSVNLCARPWVNSADYWQTRCDLQEQVKAAFDQKGISIPFPQRDVHMVS